MPKISLSMTDNEAREAAQRALASGDEKAVVDDDARVSRLDDPEAEYVAVEAWIYLPVNREER